MDDNAAAEIEAWGCGLWDDNSGCDGGLWELVVRGVDSHADYFDQDHLRPGFMGVWWDGCIVEAEV